MGEVYRAHDPRLGRDVAIKILPPEIRRQRSDRLARFEREARLLAALNHPHIGAIYGCRGRGGRPRLVLELVEGETLGRSHRRGPAAGRGARGSPRQIAEALDARTNAASSIAT